MNIIIGGVGGQGLVLTTKIMAQAAFKAGFDVKTNDVIGLSQRVGGIWGSVKYGDKVYSPNITKGEADIIIAFEPLEALRYLPMLKAEGGIVISNSFEMAPMYVQQGARDYPADIYEQIGARAELIALDATREAEKLGNLAVVNILMLGIAARKMDIDKDVWLEAILSSVPERFKELNEQAFEFGYNYV